jgi:hypothetical protein
MTFLLDGYEACPPHNPSRIENPRQRIHIHEGHLPRETFPELRWVRIKGILSLNHSQFQMVTSGEDVYCH